MNPHTEGVLYAMVTDGGVGYTSVPTVAIQGSATAVAVVASGVVTHVLLTDRGDSYTTAPTITISGGGGTGAAATAHVGIVSTILQGLHRCGGTKQVGDLDL